MPVARAGDLSGGDRDRHLAVARSVLAGEPGPARDIVLVNAAAGLVAAGKVETFLKGVEAASTSLDSGAARDKVQALAKLTRATT